MWRQKGGGGKSALADPYAKPNEEIVPDMATISQTSCQCLRFRPVSNPLTSIPCQETY